MNFEREDLVQRHNDIINWRLQADEWKKKKRKKDDLANRVLGYVFLKNQDFNWCNDDNAENNDSITATRDYFSPRKRIRKKLNKEKLSRPQLFESSLNIATNVNVQDPFQFFDYPVPDELMGFLANDSKLMPSVKELHKLKKRVARCTSPVVIRHCAREKFKEIYSKIQKHKSRKIQNRCTQTDVCVPCFKYKSHDQQETRLKPTIPDTRCKPTILETRFKPIVPVQKCIEEIKPSTQEVSNAHLSSDIDVVVDNRIFRAHKVMLMAFSQWFHRTLNNIPRNTTRVVLENIDANCFDIIFKWMYTYKLNVSLENISSVMTVAKRLEMPFLLKKLRNTVLKIIVLMGPLAVFNAAEKMCCQQLVTNATFTLNEKISCLAQSHAFLHYTVDDLCLLFSPKYAVHPKPTETCYLLVLWLAHNWSNRKFHVLRVLDLMPVEVLTNEELLQCVRIVKDCNLIQSEDCRETILRYFKESVTNPCNRSKLNFNANQPAGSTNNFLSQLDMLMNDNESKTEVDPKLLKDVVAIQKEFCISAEGGDISKEADNCKPQQMSTENVIEEEVIPKNTSTSKTQSHYRQRTKLFLDHLKPIEDSETTNSTRSSNHSYCLLAGGIDPFCEGSKDEIAAGATIHCYSFDENRWGILDYLPASRHHAAAAMLHGAIYFTGGSGLFNGDYFEATNRVWCYEYLKGRWSTKNPMILCRVYHALVAVDGLLYAIGGMDSRHQLLKSIEFYDPACEMWCHAANLVHARMAMSTAIYHKMIVICGGVGEDSSTTNSLLLSSCELFVPQSKKVLKMKSLRIPRCFASLLEVEGKLHLIGGATVEEGGNQVCVVSIKDIDVWDESSKSWVKKNELKIQRQDGVAVCLGAKMYIMGGQSSELNSTILSVECFDHSENKWISGIASLPVGLSGSCCALLENIPRLMMKKLKISVKM